jgi:hypothetical protein
VNISVSERRSTPYAPRAPVQAHQAKKFAEGVDVRTGVFSVAGGVGDSARRSGLGAGGMTGSRDMQTRMADVNALK